MLAEHRGDLVLEWSKSAWPSLRRQGLQVRVIDTGIEVARMPFHLLIRNGSPHVRLLEPFDRTIEAMKTEGAIAAIV